MRSERERLLDILEAIGRIEKYARRAKADFLQDELIQNWMVNHITLIGEACRALPEDFQAEHANVPGQFTRHAQPARSSLFRH